MTRLMYDSTTASDIPRDAEMVAGYVDIWTEADWALFPNAIQITIARNINETAMVLDIEATDAEPGQAPNWVLHMRNSFHTDPTVYMSESAWQAVRDAFIAQGVPEPHYWVASYSTPPDPSIPDGAVAHQYIDPPGSGGHYDLSSVADYWPGVDMTPTQAAQLQAIYNALGGDNIASGVNYLGWSRSVTQALSQLVAALGADQAGVNYLGWSRDVTAALNNIQAELAKAPPAPPPAA